MFIEILLVKIIKEFLVTVKDVSLGMKNYMHRLKNSMDNQLFERCFIFTACEYGVKQYGSIMSYAKKIWPEKDDKNAAQTLYAIQKKSSKTGKPQGLPLHLAVLMVDLLQDAPSFPSFCFEISEKIRLGWGNEGNDISLKSSADVLPSKKESTENQEDCTHGPVQSSALGDGKQPEADVS